MRDPNLLAERNKAIDSKFNEQYKELKADPKNRLASDETLYKLAISRTASTFYLSCRTIEKVLRSPVAV